MAVKLSEDHYKKLGNLLFHALPNKDRTSPNPYDLQRTSVLFFSVFQRGFDFGEEELEGVMQESGGGYSEGMDESLEEIRAVCHALYNGLNDPRVERFKLKDFH